MSLRETLALLASKLDGRLAVPGDPGYDADRTAWNLAVDQRPVAVVTAASADDLVNTVRIARSAGLAVAAQATGHNAGPLTDRGLLSDAILVRTSEMRAVTVDADERVARVEPGAQWGDVVAAVSQYGLTALSGSSHDVGVAGYTLGGGLSWLARAYGIAANHVTAIEIVTADGRLRRIDADRDADLFWAVRGGGGDFGVVAAFEFRLYEIPQIVAGTLFFPFERAEEVLQAWREWTTTVPDSVTSVGRLLQFPPLPDLPAFLSGKSYVVVEAAILESPARADELLAPLRALGPTIDSVHPQATSELLQLHMDPPAPVPGYGDGLMLIELSADTVSAFVRAAGPGSGSTLLSAEIRHLGGAVKPDAARANADRLGLPQPGVTAGFEAEYLVFGVGIPTPGEIGALAASVDRLVTALDPWRADLEYLNFAERVRDPEAFFGERLAKLRQVKRAYDPTRVIRSNHPVDGI
ncbi:FAD-binding oxidoreductase [Agromyces protaetiae]|uniref:FAD-binding oxidoreductase n=1 Tax=Agromyces protaetiae TaxID=2509455 RepID=A0A4P6FJU2_9MICO|nr:FAD-binding oxidoreductase [Agromyces protaetiae]